jgi:hypothetical protein
LGASFNLRETVMSNRPLFALTLSVALVPAAWAADDAAGDVVLLAQASTSPGAGPAQSDATARMPMQGGRRGVHEAAEKGPDALRRYIFRTRNIYAYSFDDYAKPEWYR